MNSTAADQRMMTLFRLVFRVLERNYSQGNFIYLSQVLSVILSEVYFREKTNESPAGRRIVTKAVHYMTEHLSGQLRLEQLCDMFRISGSYLNVIFREETGHAPLDFFLHLKMQEACRLLEAGFASTSSGQPFEKALEAIPACTFQPDMRLTSREALAHWNIQPRTRRLARPTGSTARSKADRRKNAKAEARGKGARSARNAKSAKAAKHAKVAKQGKPARQAKAGRRRGGARR